MRYPHLASRIFGVPLLIERHKLDVILSAIGPRLGVEIAHPDPPEESIESAKKRKPYSVTRDGIAVLEVMGPLVKRASGAFMSGGPTTYGEIENEFTDAITDPAIKAVMLLVDSPGGESVGAFELSDLIYSQRGSKPIYAVSDGDAFSAAYALASAADRVFVTKSGGVGSVGVWMLHADWSKAEEKAGVKVTYIYAGERKIDGNPDNPLSKEAKTAFQAEVDRIYDMFVDTVARNRGMSSAAVKKTEAGLFFGESSLDVGFADDMGTFNEALAELRAELAPQGVRKSLRAAAASASHLNAKGGIMDEKEKKTDAELAAEKDKEEKKAAVVEEREVELTLDITDKSKVLTYAADVVDLCMLAGMPKLASGFIRANKSTEDIRKELLAARAAQDANTEINTGVLPETGAESNGRNVKDSHLVKLAEKMAADAKAK